MRILIYRLGSLGDTVVALPCFHLIRRTYPAAQITVLTNAPVSSQAAPLESVLENSGLIDATIHYPAGLRDPAKLMQLRSHLRAQHFDLLISLTAARGLLASLRDYLFFKACGIPKIIGIPISRENLVLQPRTDGLGFESETTRLLRRIRPIGSIDLLDRGAWDLKLTPEEIGEAKRLLEETGIKGNFIAASIGTKSSLNDWGQQRWNELLAELSRAYPGLGLVLLGSAEESDRSEALLARWEGPRANLCGKTSPRISAALLHEARLFIGHDSGPMHLAAAMGTRCVAIFSARNPPGQWFPHGDGHALLYPEPFFDPKLSRDIDHQQKALASIRVEDVLAAARRGLD